MGECLFVFRWLAVGKSVQSLEILPIASLSFALNKRSGSTAELIG